MDDLNNSINISEDDKNEFIDEFIDDFFISEGTTVNGCFGTCGKSFEDDKNLCGKGCKKINKRLTEEEILDKKAKLRKVVLQLLNNEKENLTVFSLKNYLLNDYFNRIIKETLSNKNNERIKKELEN